MELDLILGRLMAVTGQKNLSSMCTFIGFRPNAYGDWKKRDTIPFKACLAAAQKTGYTMEWILTGEGAQKHGDPVPFSVDEKKLVKDFKDVIVSGIEDEVLNTGKRWNAETLELLTMRFYKRFTGFVSIPEPKQQNRMN